MNPKPVIISGVIAVLFVASVYFGGKYVFEQGRLDYTPITSQEKPTVPVVEQKQPPAANGHPHGDVGYADELQDSSASKGNELTTAQSAATVQDEKSLKTSMSEEEYFVAMRETLPLLLESVRSLRESYARSYQALLDMQKEDEEYYERTGKRRPYTNTPEFKGKLAGAKESLDTYTISEASLAEEWRKYENQ